MKTFQVGNHVRIPWGIGIFVDGRVLEVWGDPENPTQYRIQLSLEQDTDDEPAVLLLSPDVVEAA